MTVTITDQIKAVSQHRQPSARELRNLGNPGPVRALINSDRRRLLVCCPQCNGSGQISPDTIQRKHILDRLDSHWLPDPYLGCWVWTSSLNDNGYGQMSIGQRGAGSKKVALAHRVSYEIFRGAITPGLVLDHLCRNRYCINPWHLEEVTVAENTRRGNAGKHTKPACRHGHPYTTENVYQRPDGARGCRECLRNASKKYRSARPAQGAML